MSELKAYQVDSFIQNKPKSAGFYLVYGSDTGLVRERSRILCAAQNTDNVTVLDMGEIDADPSKLSVEALTPSLFGDTPVIRVRNASKSLEPIVKELLDQNFDAFITIEAGSLTKRDKLRVLIEKAKNGWTLPSFADDDKSLSILINQTFAEQNINIDTDVTQLLCSILGNDREITRRELEKLVNFASESKNLTANDVLTLCGDNATLALDELVDAVGMGQLINLETALNRSYAAGQDSQLILNVCNRHFQFLRNVRAKIDSGSNAGAALANTFPRPHFSRKNKIDQQVSRWSSAALSKASTRIFEATLQSRQQAPLSETITRRALLGICVVATRQ